MSVLYSFKKSDGTIEERFFPMGECPDKITLENGEIAVRVFSCPSISWGSGSLPPGEAMKRNRDMIDKQQKADKRMRERWKSCKD